MRCVPLAFVLLLGCQLSRTVPEAEQPRTDVSVGRALDAQAAPAVDHDATVTRYCERIVQIVASDAKSTLHTSGDGEAFARCVEETPERWNQAWEQFRLRANCVIEDASSTSQVAMCLVREDEVQAIAENPDPAASPSGAEALPAAMQEQLDTAWTLYESGDREAFERADAVLTGLLSERPDASAALALLAIVQLELGRTEDSMVTALRCVVADSSESVCWLTLGVLSQSHGDYETASFAYQLYLALDPEGRYVEEARRQLPRLRRPQRLGV